MKPFALTLLLVPTIACAQTPTSLYGKSRPQALAMGEQKWMDFVSDHSDGNSTHGMAQAMDFFATAAGERNNGLIAKLPRARRASIRSARQALREAGFALVATDRELAGGGTMYQLFFPSRAADVELVFFKFLKGRTVSKPVSTATLDATRTKWRKALKQNESVEDKARFDASVTESEKRVDQALSAIAKLSPSERSVCLTMLVEWLTPEFEQIGTR